MREWIAAHTHTDWYIVAESTNVLYTNQASLWIVYKQIDDSAKKKLTILF